MTNKDNGGPASDRELLEMAAKAAGYQIEWVRNSGCHYRCEDDMSREQWCPLDDDGDALRLAVNLGLVVDAYAMRAISATRLAYGHNDWVYGLDDDDDMDEHEATRRAIVRAAAAIGSAM